MNIAAITESDMLFINGSNWEGILGLVMRLGERKQGTCLHTAWTAERRGGVGLRKEGNKSV